MGRGAMQNGPINAATKQIPTPHAKFLLSFPTKLCEPKFTCTPTRMSTVCFADGAISYLNICKLGVQVQKKNCFDAQMLRLGCK